MNQSTTMTTAQATSRTQVVGCAVLAIVFGVFLLFATGFSQPASIHNAAHDTRHAFAFPCH